MTRGPGGQLVLLAGGGQTERFTWEAGANGPIRSALPAFPGSDDQRWAANTRGDAVLATGQGTRVRALAIDATGTQALMSETLRRTHTVDALVTDVGPDGTSAVAWTTQDDETGDQAAAVWVRVRVPGGAFGPPIDVPAAGPVRELDLRVRANGLVELAHADWFDGLHQIFYIELGVDAPVSPPALLASSHAATPFVIALVPGADGIGRVVYEDPPDVFENPRRLVTRLRTADGTWAPAQQIAEDAFTDVESLADLADGTVALAYVRRDSIFVTRAQPGAAFGPAVRVGRAAPGWWASSGSVALSARGDVLVAWIESTDDNRLGISCGGLYACHERVVAAGAGAGLPFAAPERISALGTIAGALTAGISDAGGSVIAWQQIEGESDARTSGPLMAARSDARPTAAAPVDRRRPHVQASLSHANLRAAARSAPLRVRVECNEACAVRLSVSSRDDPDLTWLDELPAIVLDHRGVRTARWTLTRRQHRQLRRLLAAGPLRLPAIATDDAGNLRATRVRITDR
jgi:hypothetical protein